MRADEVMTSPVIVVDESTSIREAARLLAEHGFTLLPVLDHTRKVVGVVTEADIIRAGYARDPRPTPEPEDGVQLGPGARTVGAIMRPKAVTVTAELELPEVVETMLQTRVRSVPVQRDGRLVGIVTRRDLIRVLTGRALREPSVRQWLVALSALPPVPPVEVTTAPLGANPQGHPSEKAESHSQERRHEP